jgi:hypothetical protein
MSYSSDNFIIFGIVMIPLGISWHYLRRYYERYLELLASGITAMATVTGKYRSSRYRDWLCINYEFHTPTGDLRNGNGGATYNDGNVRKYVVGHTFPILYSENLRNSLSFPKEELPAQIKNIEASYKPLRIVLAGVAVLMFFKIIIFNSI